MAAAVAVPAVTAVTLSPQAQAWGAQAWGAQAQGAQAWGAQARGPLAQARGAHAWRGVRHRLPDRARVPSQASTGVPAEPVRPLFEGDGPAVVVRELGVQSPIATETGGA